MAGYKTPAQSAVLWNDGGLIDPDEVTIIFADPDVPISEPLKCGVASSGGGGGPCNTIDQSSTLNIDPGTLDPYQTYPENAYNEGMILFALKTGDCNGDGEYGIYPFEVSLPPTMTSAGGSPTLKITHNPGQSATGMNLPGGFNGEVHPDCAVIGRFKVIQYRVSPLPPSPNPTLERRDLSNGEPWIPVAINIENLQTTVRVGEFDEFRRRARGTRSRRPDKLDYQGATIGRGAERKHQPARGLGGSLRSRRHACSQDLRDNRQPPQHGAGGEPNRR